ncbi:MAG: hypothetical protein Q9164_001487 [Protoblastenia rupestris]
MSIASTTPPPPPTTAHPGRSLGPASSYLAGPGTHIYGNQIIASLSGRPVIVPTPATIPKSGKIHRTKPTITILRLLPSPSYGPIPSASISNTNILPKVGSTVLAKVLRVRTRQVDIGILCVGNDEQGKKNTDGSNHHDGGQHGGEMNVCADEWPAVIRKEDVRATEKEKVVCAEGFRVGDVVRGVVISLGDQANYYVSTAGNELGVVLARSEGGNVMQPVSWKEFRDPVTGVREGRKVAKPL